MSTIDDLLRNPASAPLPPLTRWLKNCRDEGDVLKVEVCGPESAFGSSITELFIHRESKGVEQEPRVVQWDDELNASLVDLGIPAVNRENEGERFALMLRAALRKVERRSGDGYLNSVFLTLIDESDLGKERGIAEVRKYVHANPPDQNSKAYRDTRDQIASEIAARVVELRDKLNYGEDDLKAIMSKAIARYLDRRFSVSSRRALGWL